MSHSYLLMHRMQTMVAKDVRIYNWQAAIDHIRVSPWIGTGSGTHLIYGRLYRRMQIQADPVHAHCDYLELVAEYGVVGGICMLLFVVAHIRSGWRRFPKSCAGASCRSGWRGAMDSQLILARSARWRGWQRTRWSISTCTSRKRAGICIIFGVLANPGLEHRAGGFMRNRVMPWGRLLLPGLGCG